jgi:di/tricarboxylate transporter
MGIEIIMVFAVLAMAVLLFITEWFPVDKIAFLIIVSLLALGLTDPEEAISGFANPATITVLALMIVAISLEDNGIIDWLTAGIKKLSILPLLLITPSFMLVSSIISAFISTTAVVIIFIKIVSQLSERYNFSTSKLLMPISFAGILGGSCTLMGTSTNLIVNNIALELGADRLGFFEFTMFGLVFLIIGLVFMTIASRWLPKDRSVDLASNYGIQEFLFTVTIPTDSPLNEQKIAETPFYDNPNISIIKLIRNGNVVNAPGKYIQLKSTDQLVLMSNVEDLAAIITNDNLVLHDDRLQQAAQERDVNVQLDKDGGQDQQAASLVELLVLPGSNLLGRTLQQIRQMSFKGSFPLALQKRKNLRNTKERLIRKNVKEIRIKPGDRVLVELQDGNIQDLHEMENIAILNQHEFDSHVPVSKKWITLTIFLAIIALASSGVFTILSSTIIGIGALLLANCITLEKIYKRVNWQIIFLLAGMIPLGIAMNNTGTDQFISQQLLMLFTGQHEVLVLGLVFLFTMILSGTISNNATAIITTPIAISVATGLDLPLKPFILAVMFAANFSFFTPVGYQTNALIYGTGVYKFRHFLIIGGMLSLILLVVGTLLLSTLFDA